MRKVLSLWQVTLESCHNTLESIELFLDLVKDMPPLILELIVLFETGPHLPLIFPVVVCYLRLALLVDFNLEPTLSWPLLSEVLIKFLDTLVLEGLTFI